VRDRLEFRAALAHCGQHVPVEREARRRRLERDRRPCDSRPHVPERERRGDVRVLDRSSVAREACPNPIRCAVEEQRHETRVTKQSLDSRAERPEDESVAGRDRRWRSAIFRARVKVSLAEDHCPEASDIFGP